MPTINLQSIIDFAKKFFSFLLPFFKEVVVHARCCYKNYAHSFGIKGMMKDATDVFRNVALFFVLNLVVFVLFVSLPEGKDILLIVAEYLHQWSVMPFIFLLLGLSFWAITSEFAARYMIYTADNSGWTLTDYQVEWRKLVQRICTFMFLLLPFLIVGISILTIYLRDYKKGDNDLKYQVIIILGSIYFIYRFLAVFYFNIKKRKERRKSWGTAGRLFIISDEEKKWLEKLYGIYNPYTYSLPGVQSFAGGMHDDYEKLSHYFIKNADAVAASGEQPDLINNFPQSEHLDEAARVPEVFKLIECRSVNDNCYMDSTGAPDEKTDKKIRDNYKWVYSIPRSFYGGLHLQLKVLFGVGAGILLIFLFMNIEWYKAVGTAALVTFALAVWISVYIMLIYLDYRFRFFSPRFFRLVLPAVLLIICSRWNDDHPIRYVDAETSFTTRKPIDKHFETWVNGYFNNSEEYLKSRVRDTAKKANTPKDSAQALHRDTLLLPVFFVCAEGGALRTGAYASLLLSGLQDSLHAFDKSIYCFSSVSGGTVGVGLFNGLSYLQRVDPSLVYIDHDKTFFTYDYLSPSLGKLLYGEVINLFLPNNISRFNRENALEQGWEMGFGQVKGSINEKVFGGNFLNVMDKNPYNRAWFINTTEVESGLQCWVTNVIPDTNFIFVNERDLFNADTRKLNGNLLNYSTAMSLSTRFPLVSPAAMVESEGKKLHYTDGGYVENSGAQTMLEVLQSLTRQIDSVRINPFDTFQRVKLVPYVMQLNFGTNSRDSSIHVITTGGNLNFGNELSEIVSSMYNTRIGRTTSAKAMLERYTILRLRGKYAGFDLASHAGDVPMSWVLSDRALKKIVEQVKKDLSNKRDFLTLLDSANHHFRR